jgi:hypothetical protein
MEQTFLKRESATRRGRNVDHRIGKTAVVFGAIASALLGLSACGGGDSAPPSVVTQIYSDPAFDGDIEQTAPSSYTVTQGMSPSVQSVLVGIDPVAGTEFRAFLDFPLSGPEGVPANANIDSAYLEFYVNDLQPGSEVLPIRVDLVAFQPPTLVETDFDRSLQPALASTTLRSPLSPGDIGHHVIIDVTGLMIVAQQHGLEDFQVRILEDLGPAIYALASIDDSTGADRLDFAPVLTVTYY